MGEASPFTHGKAEQQIGVQLRQEGLEALLLQCCALDAAETAVPTVESAAIDHAMTYCQPLGSSNVCRESCSSCSRGHAMLLSIPYSDHDDQFIVMHFKDIVIA